MTAAHTSGGNASHGSRKHGNGTALDGSSAKTGLSGVEQQGEAALHALAGWQPLARPSDSFQCAPLPSTTVICVSITGLLLGVSRSANFNVSVPLDESAVRMNLQRCPTCLNL